MTGTDQAHISDELFADEPHEIVIEPPATPVKHRKRRKEKPPRRPLLRRLFGISIWGLLKLAFLCILVGFFVLASQFDPRSPSFDAPSAFAAIAREAWVAAGWAVTHFWKPALAGATVVLPIWTLWRLVTLPFRR